MAKQKFRYTARKVECIGKCDGRGWRYSIWPFKQASLVQPADDEEGVASFEQELIKAADDDLADLAIEWSERDKVLKPKYCQALLEVEMCAQQLDVEERDRVPSKKEFDEAEDEYEALNTPAIGKTAEWIYIGILAICEYFFNYIIFNILEVENVDTHIIAGGISFALPLAAKFLGETLRIEKKKTTDKVFAILLGCVPILVFIGISVLRAALFEGDWSGDEGAPPISPAMASSMFVLFNLLFFSVGIYLSYRAGYADPELYKTLKTRMMRARSRFEKDNRDFEEAAKKYQIARIAFEQAKHKRKEEFDLVVAHAQDLIKIVKLYIKIYRDANIGERQNGTIPLCFKREVSEIQLPLALQPNALDWNCNVDHPLVSPSGINLN